MSIEYFKYNILPLKNKLFRKAYSITRSATESQDVIQDVMMRLWDKRDEWSAIGNMEVYAMVLTRNMALDKVKKFGFHDSGSDIQEIKQVPSSDNPHQSMEKKERIALIWDVINQLAEKEQELVKLREIEELSYREIGQILDINESQVKKGLFVARQKMKNIYLKINTRYEY